MEIQTTEVSENLAVIPVTNTEPTENLDQPTVLVVDQPQKTTEMLEQSSSCPVPNTEKAEAALPPAIHSLEPEVTNTLETEPLEESALQMVTTDTPTTETLEQSSLADMKTTETTEQSLMPSDVTDNSHDNLIASLENHQGMEIRQETPEEREEVRSVLKVIAATGKFCDDWEKFRSMLSLHLKQVISEYPQAKMTLGEQKLALGETHAELVKRLDDALHSFVDGPPFTIQRLSEIILDARNLYSNLSKLALALEKNLSVTSTLVISTNSCLPSVTTPPNGLDKVTEDPTPTSQQQSDTMMENGAQPMSADRDEIMTEVEADVGDVMTMDVETNEKSSDSSPMTTDMVGSSGVLVQPTGMSKL
uniref:uncharacterized protein LOC122611220 n=1 Tax=Erigeron canadensis TaxID=72917 RepID=UPI001CB94EF8|nr:uncharacterized protein LOC122611220 [Erigeron canadensis]